MYDPSQTMDILFAPFYFLFAHTFLGTGIFIVLGFWAVRWLSKRQGALAEFAKSYGFLLILMAALLKLFLGHGIAVRLVHVLGQDARGLVVDRYETSTMYNNHLVYGYHVLLALADGRTVQAKSFRTDSFNVYPPPQQHHLSFRGHPLRRALPSALPLGLHHPVHRQRRLQRQNLQCDRLRMALRSAELKHQFAPDNLQFRTDTPLRAPGLHGRAVRTHV